MPVQVFDFMEHQPINNIIWQDADELSANDYNPNIVFTPEMKLLKFSLLTTGWIQPILCDNSFRIIDGFHRWHLSRTDADILKKYHGLVPCCVLDLSEPERMLLTIRINRAKGTHQAIKMHEIITTLHHVHHYPIRDIAEGIGANKDEIELLLKENVFSALNIEKHQYSKAWIPNK